jgi:ribosomal protein S18 acetylase RimI-like enzyme
MTRVLRLTDERDFLAMLDVERELVRRAPQRWHYHPCGLVYNRYLFGDGADDVFEYGRVIETRQGVVGYAQLEADDGLFMFRVLPHSGVRLGGVIARITRELSGKIVAEVTESDTRQSAALRRQGFRELGTSRICLVCNLAGHVDRDIGETDIRAVTDDDAERVAAIGVGTDARNTALYRAFMRSPYYNAVDLVARVDGDVAAHVMFLTDDETRTALLEFVVCEERYRRRGVTKALISQGLSQLKQRGFEYVCVSTGFSNAAAIGLYKSVGFAQSDRVIQYSIQKSSGVTIHENDVSVVRRA